MWLIIVGVLPLTRLVIRLKLSSAWFTSTHHRTENGSLRQTVQVENQDSHCDMLCETTLIQISHRYCSLFYNVEGTNSFYKPTAVTRL